MDGLFSNSTSYTDDYLNSSNIVSKVAFLILVLVLFMVFARLGTSFLSWWFRPSGTQKIINGMIPADQMLVIPQDPSVEGAKTIIRSINQDAGIEFTWSVWIYIENLTYNANMYKCVFYKGNDYTPDIKGINPNTKTIDIKDNGLNFPNNAPGLYITPNKNNMVVIMNTFQVINEEITIENVPLNKWVNVTIRCENEVMDVYINGMIVKSHKLHGIPKQNYGNVYVGMNGGFNGNISNLWYYDYALGITEIQNISTDGPNTYMIGSNGMSLRNPDYLSLRWYFYGAGDMFNPSIPSTTVTGQTQVKTK